MRAFLTVFYILVSLGAQAAERVLDFHSDIRLAAGQQVGLVEKWWSDPDLNQGQTTFYGCGPDYFLGAGAGAATGANFGGRAPQRLSSSSDITGLMAQGSGVRTFPVSGPESDF